MISPIQDNEIDELSVAYASSEFWRLRLQARQDTVYMHILTVRPNHCHVSFTGGYGGYANEWWHTGVEEANGGLKFLSDVEPSYLLSKLCNEKKYRGDLTEQKMRRHVVALRRARDIDAETARAMWDSISDDEYSPDSPLGLSAWMEQWQDAIGDYWEFETWGPSRDLEFLCFAIFPVFRDFIRRGLKNGKDAGVGDSQGGDGGNS
jgi:hypothetical protein